MKELPAMVYLIQDEDEMDEAVAAATVGMDADDTPVEILTEDLDLQQLPVDPDFFNSFVDDKDLG
ncbi:hypothetical protein Cni_G28078 [Canna indica]|uniref:Small acidic protein 1 n=1 Tax=Canna indica TaxID=4628 RepID=A0AAQ3L389_9LILI|nr:hypothetical protein Cni_G28078 [Canna indica]